MPLETFSGIEDVIGRVSGVVAGLYPPIGVNTAGARRPVVMASPLALTIEYGHLPVRYPGRYDIRVRSLRGENVTADTDNTPRRTTAA